MDKLIPTFISCGMYWAVEHLGFLFFHNTRNPRLPCWRNHCIMELPSHGGSGNLNNHKTSQLQIVIVLILLTMAHSPERRHGCLWLPFYPSWDTCCEPDTRPHAGTTLERSPSTKCRSSQALVLRPGQAGHTRIPWRPIKSRESPSMNAKAIGWKWLRLQGLILSQNLSPQNPY